MSTWDEEADKIKAEIDKYGKSTYEAMVAGEYDKADEEWAKAMAARAKLLRHLFNLRNA